LSKRKHEHLSRRFHRAESHQVGYKLALLGAVALIFAGTSQITQNRLVTIFVLMAAGVFAWMEYLRSVRRLAARYQLMCEHCHRPLIGLRGCKKTDIFGSAVPIRCPRCSTPIAMALASLVLKSHSAEEQAAKPRSAKA
jgi:hypothetical protein